jgi:hypothetical protein
VGQDRRLGFRSFLESGRKVAHDQTALPNPALPGSRVAYDPFGQDTPFDFAIKMGYQKSFLTDLADANNNPVWPAWNSSAAPPLNSTNYRNSVVTPSDWSGANYSALTAVFIATVCTSRRDIVNSCGWGG